MHLDAAMLRVVKRVVLEVCERKIRMQLSIQSRQQVQVEFCSHTARVVVRPVQYGGVLHEIGTEQQAIAGPHRSRNMREQPHRFFSREIANRAAEERDECWARGGGKRKGLRDI